MRPPRARPPGWCLHATAAPAAGEHRLGYIRVDNLDTIYPAQPVAFVAPSRILFINWCDGNWVPTGGQTTHATTRRRSGAQGFGLHALMLVPLTPLQSWSGRQSEPALQILTQFIAAPATASQTDSSGHWAVEPDVVHAFVQ